MFLNLLLFLTLTANATEPAKFTILEYKAPAPFAGILFDEFAMAKILSGYDMATYSCDIKIEYELNKYKQRCQFKIENLEIEHKALTQEYDLFIIQKDREIELLANALKKTSPRYKWLYFAGGLLAGTAASYGAYTILNEK